MRSGKRGSEVAHGPRAPVVSRRARWGSPTRNGSVEAASPALIGSVSHIWMGRFARLTSQRPTQSAKPVSLNMRSLLPANSRSATARGLSAAGGAAAEKSCRSHVKVWPDARARRVLGDDAARKAARTAKARQLVLALLRAGRVSRSPFWIAERSWRDCVQTREAALFVWEVADLARAATSPDVQRT